MGKWIVLGAAAMDTVVRVPHHPKKDEIVYPDSIEYLPGGSSANVAVGLSRLAESAAFLGKTGDDAAGAAIRQSFLDEGVDVSGLLVRPGGRSGGAFVAVDAEGDRVIYSLGGEALYETPEELDASAFSGITGLYIGEAFGGVAVRAAELAHAQGADVYFGPGGIMCSYGLSDLSEIIEVSDYLLVNLPEALSLSEKSDKDSVIDCLFSAGAKYVVLTEGKAGAGCYAHRGEAGNPEEAFASADWEKIFVPALEVKTVDTTGAGDSFTAGFLKARSLGCGMKESLMFAASCAAKAVQSLGARSSMPHLDEVEDAFSY